MKTYILIFALLLMVGCKPKQLITSAVQDSTSELIIKTDKLTPVALPLDSTYIRAKFECDSNFNVVLAELNEIKTKAIQSTFNWNNGNLDLLVKSGGDTVYIPGSDFYWKINSNRVITKTITIVIEKKMSWLQTTLIKAGSISLIAFFLILIIWLNIKFDIGRKIIGKLF